MATHTPGDDPQARPRILLVEDEQTLREHLAEVLSDEYIVNTAADGESALRSVLRHRPELVVTDLVMPVLDGIELVRLLRNTPSTATTPILMISGRAPDEVRIEGFELGADSYLPKPYTERELRARIRAMLQGSRLRTKAAQREAREKAERRAMEERAALLAAEVNAMTRLHELVNRLLVCTDLRTALEEVLNATITLVGADKGNVQLLDPKTQSLQIVAQRGFTQEFLDHFRSVRADDSSACARVMAAGGSVIIEDVEQDPEFAPHRGIAASAGFRAVQSTALRSRGGDLLGVLSTHFREPHRPSPREQRMVDLYARQAADFIERMRVEEALRQGERRKDEFLATLAHELRNPLAPIRNGLQLLQLRGSTDPAIQRVSQIMQRQMNHLVRLVDDLLDVSRISQGKLELRRERVPLTEVLSSAVEASAHLIETHGHELNIEVRAEGVVIDGDPNRLAQIFSNLLSNSAKYTDRGGRIQLSLEREGDVAVTRVTDNGIGIAPDALDRVFDMFSQVHDQGRRSDGGLGIGLALVRRLVEMHDGAVTAISDGLGKGSTFVVRLPIAETHVRVAGEHAATRDSGMATTARRRVLVVDDNVDAAASLAMVLEVDHNEVRVANDGERAVELVTEFAPDIIFMDIGMPRMNGLEAMRRIRSLPDGRHPLIVALSGWGQEADQQRSRQAGADYHLVKPISSEALRNLLHSAGAASERVKRPAAQALTVG